MTQLRFQVNGRFAGSAAKRSEDEGHDAPTAAADFKIAVGSAARDAEDRKRAERGDEFTRTTGFSLRAQNGMVQRHAAVTPVRKDSECVDQVAAHAQNAVRSDDIPLDHQGHSSFSANLQNSHPSPAGHEKHTVARAQSLLRRIFPAFGKDS
jgi:hypothetical protein